MKIDGFRDTIAWYDQNAERYAEAGKDFFDLNHISAFVSALPSGASVLDMGCGPGRDMRLLAERGLTVTGIDVSSGLLEVGKRTSPELEFVEGNFLSMPFEDASFDGLWANSSLLHLETADDAGRALQEAHRVLKPNGVLHIVVKAQTGQDKTAIVHDKLSNHERFFRYFTLNELRGLVEEAGFGISHIKQYGEVESIPAGRPEVQLIWTLARKA